MKNQYFFKTQCFFIFQGMYELPDSLNNRIILYLNVLPVVQDVATYALFFGGAIFLVWSVVKILLYNPEGSNSSAQWFETEMQRKRLSFLNERRASMKSKMMDTFYSSLIEAKDGKRSGELHDNPECEKEDLVWWKNKQQQKSS